MLFFLVLSSSSWVWIWCSWRTRLLCLSYQSALWVVCNGLLSSLSFPGRRGGLRASQSACVCVFVGIYAHYTETAQTLTQIRNIIVKLFCICLGVWSANCQLHCFFYACWDFWDGVRDRVRVMTLFFLYLYKVSVLRCIHGSQKKGKIPGGCMCVLQTQLWCCISLYSLLLQYVLIVIAHNSNTGVINVIFSAFLWRPVDARPNCRAAFLGFNNETK